MKRRILISAFSLPFLCATYVGTQQAAAAVCGSGELLYEDKMQSSADEAWGWGEDATRSIGAEGVSWTLDPNVSWTTFNETSLYTDFELCVDLSMQYPEKSNGWVGVTFWGVDKQNNYTVSIYPIDGGISIYRVQNGKYLKPVPYFKSDAVKTGLGVTNELSVVVTGKHVVVSVNGTKVKEFNGVPPDGGGLVGLDFGTTSEDSGPSTVTFSDLQVRQPPS